MPTLEDLRVRNDAFFTQFDNNLPVTLAEGLEEEEGPFAERNGFFTVFNEPHEITALRLVEAWDGMLKAAQTSGTDDLTVLATVLDAVEAAFAVQNADLVKHALAVLITKNPVAQPLHIPPLRRINPLLVLPSHPGVNPNATAQGGLGPEARLDYFREAEQYNEHHTKWHRVFPGNGSFLASPDRQGELFWYMHQQMLARYDTERLCVGLPRVVAFGDYRAAVSEGYEVEPGQATEGFTSRAEGQRFRNFPGFTVADLEALRDNIRRAIQRGAFRAGNRNIPITADALGGVLEPNIGAVVRVGAQRLDLRNVHGFLHNTGHGFFGALSPAPNPNAPGGVMNDPTAAVRDPVFYRWHRHIDDLFVEWQNTLPENDLNAGAPPVILRKNAQGRSSDIGIALLSDLPGTPANGTQFDGAAFGAATFGGANWNTPLTSFQGAGKPLTDTLVTRIATEVIDVPSGPVTKFILDHDEFAYFLRLENTAATPQRVTVRIFLAASSLAANRRFWIEMDKFLYSLRANEKAVVYRPARLASVVRKPAARPGEPSPGADDLCDCGWPYHMLLPRGRRSDEAPMRFQLLVLLTDAEEDLVDPNRHTCGSISFCGARNSRYPDRKPMGYPFDRPFRTRTIAATIGSAELPHLAVKDLNIQHRG